MFFCSCIRGGVTRIAVGFYRCLQPELTARWCWTARLILSLPSSILTLMCLLLIDDIFQNISSKSSTFSEFLLLPGVPFKAPQASPSTSPDIRVLKEDFYKCTAGAPERVARGLNTVCLPLVRGAFLQGGGCGYHRGLQPAHHASECFLKSVLHPQVQKSEFINF